MYVCMYVCCVCCMRVCVLCVCVCCVCLCVCVWCVCVCVSLPQLGLVCVLCVCPYLNSRLWSWTPGTARLLALNAHPGGAEKFGHLAANQLMQMLWDGPIRCEHVTVWRNEFAHSFVCFVRLCCCVFFFVFLCVRARARACVCVFLAVTYGYLNSWIVVYWLAVVVCKSYVV